MQTSRECVNRAIENKNPDRIPICLEFDQDNYNKAVVHHSINN